MEKVNKRALGSRLEEEAARFLTANGVRIVAHNYRTKVGEIDLIGMDGDTLVFFEVKYRKGDRSGVAAEAVDRRKIAIICRVSDWYRMENHVSADKQIRYDVIAIDKEDIQWIRNAFEYSGKCYM